MRKSSRIPNFRNLGIHLRVLLLHVGLLLLLALLSWQPALENNTLWSYITGLGLYLLPPLLLVLGALTLCYPVLSRWPYRQGMAAILGLAVLINLAVATVYQQSIAALTPFNWLQVVLVCMGDSVLSLYYLDLLQRAYSPAIAEARLQALQARIRPHFLFNSLNAVLSLIRSQPQRAETALEDMAELFRVLMADNRDLVPLSQEVALCQQYLNIEKLRLDERLQCDWQHAAILPDVMIPPLILQPLLENAVYHGIEPQSHGGVITIEIDSSGKRLLLRISNPLPPTPDKSGGNKMALKNIRERLRLHYDLEAQLVQYQADQRYVVEITLPTRPLSEVMHG